VSDLEVWFFCRAVGTRGGGERQVLKSLMRWIMSVPVLVSPDLELSCSFLSDSSPGTQCFLFFALLVLSFL
jgi:hypothetical protein